MSRLAGRVAVVIVNYNAGPHLRRTLAGLAAQRRPADRVIVVDNGSDDGSAADLSRYLDGVEILRPPTNLGFAAGNNHGVAAAHDCEWVALLNPDAIPEPDWLSELMVAAAAAPGCAMFASRLVQDADPGRLDGTGDEYFQSGLALRRDHGRPAARGSTAGEVFGPCGAAALFRRDAFVGAGGFAERYFCYFEDVDLAFRLRLRGERCRYVPSASVRHVGSVTAGRESDFTVYHAHRNLVWTYATNMPRPLVRRSLPAFLALNFGSVVWFSLRGQPGPILRAKRDALRGLPWALRRRREVQRGRRVGAQAIGAMLSEGRGGWRRAAGRALASARGRSSGRCR